MNKKQNMVPLKELNLGAPSVRKVPQSLVSQYSCLCVGNGVACGYAVLSDFLFLKCSWNSSSISSGVGSLTIPTPL